MAASPREHSAAVAIEQLRPHIERYIHRMVRDDADTEDLVQETFARVTRGLPHFRGEAALSTWVYRVAMNVCLDFFRRRGARPVVANPAAGSEGSGDAPAEDPTEDPPLTPEGLFERSEMGECVREYVDSLPEAQRAALILHDLEGLTNPETAEVLGWSLDKVKINVHRARRRLRERIERECRFFRDARNVLRCERLPARRGPQDDD